MVNSSASIFQLGKDTTPYRLITDKHVKVESWRGREMLIIEAEALTTMAREAFHDVSHFLRASHLEQLRSILDDPRPLPTIAS